MNPWTHAIGWTLVHFVWQGAALAVVAAVALRVCRERSANTRYAIACIALATMLASPIVTARALVGGGSALAPVARSSEVNQTLTVVPTAVRTWNYSDAYASQELWAGVDAWLPVVVFVWLAGVSVLLIRMAGGLWRVRRLQVRSLAADASRWQAATERIASRLGLRRAVHVVASAGVDIPMALGWLRPVILLPMAALANLTPSQVEAILAHELMHIRRHDYLVNLAQTLAETLLFFHPGVWWVSGRLRAEREHCCDDAVVRMCGDPVDYAAALAELEAWRSSGTTLALAASGGSLIGRIRRMLNLPAGHEAAPVSWIVTLALTLGSAVVIGGVYVSTYGADDPVPSSMAGRAQDVEPIASPESFGWQVHPTSHFDIHYYQGLARDLEQIAASAERAYGRISTELRYDLPFRVPLVLFKTRSDFAQQGIIADVGGAGAIVRGDVISFSEPRRNRVVVLVEEDPDRVHRLITHELTHIFAFDVIPRSPNNVGRVPVWVDEGFAEYMTGVWDQDNLSQMRDIAVAGKAPRVSTLEGNVDMRSLPVTAHLGHAVFEFIEAEYGKPAVWQFLLAVRRGVVDGTGDVYQAAFNRTPDEFDSAFAEYLRRRFAP